MDEMKLIHRLIDLFKYKELYQQETCGLHPQDMYVLERIYFQGKMRVMDVAKNYNIPPSTLTGIIDRLYKKKYIERIRNEEDRRAVEVMVSEKGEKLVEKHMQEDRCFVKNFFYTLKDGQREEFKTLLEEVLLRIKKESLFMEYEEKKEIE